MKNVVEFILMGFNMASLTLIAIIHVYWAFGGDWFVSHAIPKIEGKPSFRPGMAATLTVAILFQLMGILNMTTVIFSEIDFPWGNNLLLFTAFIFLIRAVGDFKRVGLFQKRTNSSFSRYDLAYYSPWVLVMSINMFIIYFL